MYWIDEPEGGKTWCLFLLQRSIPFEDLGIFSEDEVVDYPDIALKACLGIRESKYSRGILVCGAGIGMVIVAGMDVPPRE